MCRVTVTEGNWNSKDAWSTGLGRRTEERGRQPLTEFQLCYGCHVGCFTGAII